MHTTLTDNTFRPRFACELSVAKILTTALLGFYGCFCMAARADNVWRLDPQEGGDSGQGSLMGVPFSWESTSPVEMVSEKWIRTKDLRAAELTVRFERPVTLSALIFANLNGNSSNRTAFYDAADTLLTVGDVTVESRQDDPAQKPTILDDGVGFSGLGQSVALLDPMLVKLEPSVRHVSKVVFSIGFEPGLLDFTLKGASE